MERKQTLKKLFKLSLQLLNLGLLVSLAALITYGYYIIQPTLERKAIATQQKVAINIKSISEMSKTLIPEQAIITEHKSEPDQTPNEEIDKNTQNEGQLPGTINGDNLSEAPKPLSNEEEHSNIPGATVAQNMPANTDAENNHIDHESKSTAQHQNENEHQAPATQDASKNAAEKVNMDNPYKSQKTKIAILITNLGLGKAVTEAAVGLPKPIALGVSPYTNSLKNILYKAKENGHEIFVEIPFESEKYPLDDVGPLGILTSSDDGENLSRLESILSSFPNVNGIYSLPQEKFTDNLQRFDPILDFFSHHRLLLLYGKGYGNNHLLEMINRKAVQLAVCDSYIDLNTEYQIIQQNLEKLEELSKTKGKALGYISSYPITINALAEWLKTLEKKNIELVPISEILSK
jgi:polysaccharide deacetylase 2 family uncharacterized protein YibQ